MSTMHGSARHEDGEVGAGSADAVVAGERGPAAKRGADAEAKAGAPVSGAGATAAPTARTSSSPEAASGRESLEPRRLTELVAGRGGTLEDRLLNPLWVKSTRARLRWKHVLSWGLVVITLTAFVCIGQYLTMVQRDVTTPEMVARAIIPPLIIIQGIILMLLGTGAVAAGVAGEREEGIVDFHRMTPMTPTAKIIGYLFGLPVREYFLFALTLPFLAWAAWKSDFPVLRLGHFYLVFFASVLLYHMTGLVAGMWSRKPRWASMIAQGLVVLLYFVLPQLSYVGVTFFEYLTVRPTFYVMLAEEVERAGPGVAAIAQRTIANIIRYRDVGFFNLVLHPTVFTLSVQAFLLVTMFISVHRKWRDEALHALPKAYALFAYAAVVTLVAGSLWPFVSKDTYLGTLIARMQGAAVNQALYVMLLTAAAITCIVAVLLLVLITPSRWTALNGVRRAHKHGRSRPPRLSDASSTTPLAVLMTAIAIAGLSMLFLRAEASEFFDVAMPAVAPAVAPLVLIASALLLVQGVCERLSQRAVFVLLFVMWGIPVMVAVILFAAFSEWNTGLWVLTISSPASVVVSISWFFESALVAAREVMTNGAAAGTGGMQQTEFLPGEFAPTVPIVVQTMMLVHLTLALAVQVHLFTWRRRFRRQALDDLERVATVGD